MSNEAVVLTPENLTFEHIKGWDGETMRRHLKGPLRETIYSVISKQSLAAVEAAQTQIENNLPVVTEPVDEEAARVAAEQAEQARVVEQQRLDAERLAQEQAAVPKKIVLEYQVKDENGNPIGRPTHLEAASHEELIEKMKEAHVQATR